MSRSGLLLEALLERLPYLEKEMLALSGLVGRGDVCFDVGAAGGTYALLLSYLVGSGGEVHAFEPRPSAYAFLRRMPAPANLHVHRLALGAVPGREEMLVPRRRLIPFTTRAFLRAGLAGPVGRYYPEFTHARSVAVEVATLDGFVAEAGIARVDFLKCDVEGAEPWVLEGGRLTIRRHRPVIVCEVEDRHLAKYGSTAAGVIADLRAGGYLPHVYRAGRLRPVAGPQPSENDYIFLPAH